MKKPIIIALVAGIAVLFGLFALLRSNPTNLNISPSASPTLTVVLSPSINISVSPQPTKTTVKSPTPTPTPTKTGGLVASPVPWDQLPPEASCTLQGEIKYLLVNDGPNHNNIYDNQNAKFIYKGIDHPGRLINWTVTPNDVISVGPQIFAQIPIPDGESLIGLSLPQNPIYKRYELTAVISYGRLVDGNVRLFTKACVGKTTVVLP